jgi:hypothetical protein
VQRVADRTQRTLTSLAQRLKRSSGRVLLTGYHTIPADVRGAVPFLNAAIRTAARDAGVEFVPIPTFSGHFCVSGTPWLLHADGCLHPNDAGQGEYARAVVAAIDRRAAPDSITAPEPASRLDRLADAALHGDVWSMTLASFAADEVRRAWVSFSYRQVGASSAASAVARASTRSRVVRLRPRYTNGSALLRVRLPRRARVSRIAIRLGRLRPGCRAIRGRGRCALRYGPALVARPRRR